MSDEYTPTTEEVLGMLGSYLYEYGADCDMNLPGNSPDEIVGRWLAKRDAEVAAKAWDEGANALSIEMASDSPTAQVEGMKVRITRPTNPYRRVTNE